MVLETILVLVGLVTANHGTLEGLVLILVGHVKMPRGVVYAHFIFLLFVHLIYIFQLVHLDIVHVVVGRCGRNVIIALVMVASMVVVLMVQVAGVEVNVGVSNVALVVLVYSIVYNHVIVIIVALMQILV
jgi:hypothetical protein